MLTLNTYSQHENLITLFFVLNLFFNIFQYIAVNIFVVFNQTPLFTAPFFTIVK